jgi:hypothetical protein
MYNAGIFFTIPAARDEIVLTANPDPTKPPDFLNMFSINFLLP